MISRTFCLFKMNDLRLWLTVVVLHSLLLTVQSGNHRRSAHGTLPLSKGGWRPLVGSNGVFYGSLGTAPLHAPSYKIPVPVDQFPSSARPLVARDANKLTSIAQSYRPTTHRTVQSSPAANQPINTYHNPFAIQGNGFSSYKFIQNFPVESVLVRNPQNPYAQRASYPKYQTKFKQNALQNAMLQQLTNVQPIQFGQFQTPKPLDYFGAPIEGFARPNEKKPQTLSSGMEIFKPEVFKLQDTDVASQSINQQVKTAQQQNIVHFPQYTFQDAHLPPNILGSFGSFGVQSVKGREPVFQFPTTKTTYLPPQPTKQTIFNSFSYNPNFKTTQAAYSTTTPKLQTTANQFYFGTTYSDYVKTTPAPQTKPPQYNPPKIDPNAGLKDGFKPSPQDPFNKLYHHSDFNKITTYNPIQTTTLATNHFNYNYQQQQQNQQGPQSFPNQNYNFNIKQNGHDNVGASDQQAMQQYANAPIKSQFDETHKPHKVTYEVTETTESDNSHSSTAPWILTSQSYEYNNQKPSEETTKSEFSETLGRPTTTTNIPEELAIVTEAEKGHDNSLSYDSQVETQSRRPFGDNFEPIEKHKLKDYYYKISTPTYNEFSTSRRTKKPNQSAKLTTVQDLTTQVSPQYENKDENEALPTLPPNLHFKRPSPTPEPLDKDRIRKRNKIRRRRPPLANINRHKEETTTQSIEAPQTTEAEEIHTIRPRAKTTKAQAQANWTTPTVTTDLTTSALPTVTPTIPTTIIKKKLVHRRPVTTTTTTDRPETTTQYTSEELNKESQIMKIGTRPQFPKLTTLKHSFDYNPSETPDFSHKQDEKDTPTSDIAISLSDTLKTTAESEQEFSFHKDVKPIEAKLETTSNRYRETTTSKNDEGTSTASSHDDTSIAKINRPRLRNKYNRNRLNVKDYRSRLSSTTTTTEKTVENTPKIRFPQRRIPYSENINSDSETTTERKRFTPKDPRHKLNGSEINEQEIHSLKNRQKSNPENTEGSSARISARIRNGQRRPKPTEETTETSSATTPRRPLRKKIQDAEIAESEILPVTETTVHDRNEFTSERTRSESAIMKIADKKHHQDHLEHLFEHSKRVSDLTLAASKDYNKPGMFKTVATNSRRIPNYFTIATDDPILPIEAFFPQLNQKKDS